MRWSLPRGLGLTLALSLVSVGLSAVVVDAQQSQGPTVTIEDPPDGATINGSIQISGTASDTNDSVQSVEVKIDDGAWNATSGTSSWSYTWESTTVSDGQHTITARATNSSGNTSTDSHTVTVDNTDEPPTVSIDSPSEGATVSGSVQVSGTASDPDGSVQTVQLRVDGGAWNTTSGTSSWSYGWDTTGVSDGQHALEARSYDGTSYSSVASRTVTVDNQASGGSSDQVPSVTIDNPSDGATVEGSVVIEGTASDPEGTLQRVEVRIDGGTWQTASGTSSWTYAWDTTQGADGQHTVEARSYDGGNHSPVDKHVVTVDNDGSSSETTSAPSIQIDQPSEGATVSQTITIRGSASDPEGSVAFVLVRIDDSDWREASGTVVWDRSWNTTALTNGEHVIYAKAYDNDGRISLASRTITVDNPQANETTGGNQPDTANDTETTEDAPPAVTFKQPTAGATVEGRITVTGAASEPDARDNVTLVQVRIDERRWNDASGTGAWSYTWDTTTVEPGNHTIYARASDGGQWGPVANLTVNVTVPEPLQATGQDGGDGTSPNLSLLDPEAGASVSDEITLSGTVEDSDGGSPLEVHARIDGGSWQTYEVEPGQPFEVAMDVGDLRPGDHTLDIRAYDGQAYSQTDSITFQRSGGAPQVMAGIFVVLLALGGVGLWIWSRQGSSA